MAYPDSVSKQRLGSQRETEGATLLALKLLEGAMGQGMQMPLEAGEGKERDSPPTASRKEFNLPDT